ncbi:MAG: AAA family ATPase [Steroidobacteraceae bacterium]
MSGASAFDDGVFGASPDDDLPELPAAVTDSIASWRRTIANAQPEHLRDILRNAAADLYRTRKVSKTVYPDVDGAVHQAIVDGLDGMADAADISPDDAQQIFADAQQSDERFADQTNGHATPEEPPAATSPDEFGASTVPREHVPAIEPATLITPADWPQEAPPAVDWLTSQRIPRGDVTTLHGDGGAGKTDLALQLAAGCVRRAPYWLGHDITGGPVVVVSGEEPEREVRRRIWLHAQRDGYLPESLTDLQLWFPDDAGGAVLAVPDRTGVMQPTPLFLSIKAAIVAAEPVLVVVDNVAATFAGNQNDRVMVRTYVNLWRTIARGPSRPAVLLLDHPSLSGLTNGTGRGGNMDWRNAVRCALYLRTPDDKAEADRGIRILETAKSNYGPPGNPIRLQWLDGGLQLEHTPSSLHRIAKDTECEEIFLRLLDERNAQGSHVGRKTSGMYAPKEFAASPSNGGFTKQAFAGAMQRLFVAGTIREIWDTRRRHDYIDRAARAPSSA